MPPKEMAGQLDVFTIRSTLDVIQYIGRILAFQEQNVGRNGERCVTLGYEGANPGRGSNVLFHLQHNAADAHARSRRAAIARSNRWR